MSNLLITSCLASHLIGQIEAAESSILIVQYLAHTPATGAHLRYRQLWQAMEAAARRGVRCVAVIDKPTATDTAHVAATRAAVRLANAGWSVGLRRIGPRLHAKCWVFDGSRAIIGSHNLAHQSMLGGSDISILANDAEIARDLSGQIMRFLDLWEGPDYGKSYRLF